MSTSYCIYIEYLDEFNNQIKQFIGSQMIGEECNNYQIPLIQKMEKVKFIVNWVENISFNIDKIDEIKEVIFNIENIEKLHKNSLNLYVEKLQEKENFNWVPFSSEQILEKNKLEEMNYENQ
uniref:Uncharacterized protein n=1 Tax=Meloidogyne hapla TaxID=6305 RepID=A0A1I8BJE4_MELHA